MPTPEIMNHTRAATREALLIAQQTIAGNVRAELARRQISQATAADYLGMKRQTFQPRYSGERAFRAHELVKLARWMGLSMNVFLPED